MPDQPKRVYLDVSALCWPVDDQTQLHIRLESDAVLVQLGFGPADAAHLAFAEAGQADFVTYDDRLPKPCRRVQPGVWGGSPLLYCDKENLR